MGFKSVVPVGLHVQTRKLFDQAPSVLCPIRKTTFESVGLEGAAGPRLCADYVQEVL